MTSLHHTRCFHHVEREAVARCPECARYYCRECITEHEHRVLCSACLARLLEPQTSRRRNPEVFFLPLAFGIVFLFTWFCFYSLAELLLRIPSSFHEGRLEFIQPKD